MLWCHVQCTWRTWRVQARKLMWDVYRKKQWHRPLVCATVRAQPSTTVSEYHVHVMARGAVQQLVIADTRH